ncbi:MAG TPA: hypothetical protein VJX67_27270 [Blastocatellia bacterium]|nr:hypothetical protein [Blastocatellia bacterium]
MKFVFARSVKDTGWVSVRFHKPMFVAALAACGPVNSLNPLYTEKDLVFDRSLLGDWSGGAPDNTALRFESAGDKGYRVISTEPDRNGGLAKQTEYRAHLVGLGGSNFLDVVPAQWDASADAYPLNLPDNFAGRPEGKAGVQPQLLRVGDGIYLELGSRGDANSSTGGMESAKPDATLANSSLRRAHYFFRVWSDGSTMRLAALDEDWLAKASEQGQISISHAIVDSGDKDFVLTATTSELQKFMAERANTPEAFPDTTELTRKH